MTGAGPASLLSGYRAIDLSSSMGAFCGKLLRDLGMDVVKVEPPEGDPLRGEPPFAGDQAGPERSLRFAYLNAGKRGITLDARRPRGRALLLDLIARADIVVESFEPGYLGTLDLAYERLRERQPTLVLVSISGYGQTGPYRDDLAPDIVTTAMGGLLYISGDPELPPCMPPEAQSQYYGGLYAAYGALLALWQREATGRGAHVDASIQASLALHEHIAFTYSVEGRLLKRAGSQHQHVAPANLFRCLDGYLSLLITQRHWPIFLELWKDHPPELDDPRLKANGERRQSADWINPLVEAFTSRYAKEELAHVLQQHGIPALPVNAPGEFLADPHVRDRGILGVVDHPVLGSYEQIGVPFTLDGQRPATAPAPVLGQHNAALYGGELGLARAELARLAADGVI